MEFWNRNKVWICGSLALAALFFILNKTGVYTELIKGTIYVGMLFLVLTLIPNNLLKLQLPFLKTATIYLAKIVRYRRSFGIIAGIMILWHATLALIGAGAIAPENIHIDWSLVSMVIFSKPIVPGLIALVVIVLMLLTSTRLLERTLGTTWKPLQSLVWVIPPLALMHAMLTAGELEGIIILGFGSILLLVFIEVFIYLKRPPIDKRAYRRHVFLTIVGIVLVMGLWTVLK